MIDITVTYLFDPLCGWCYGATPMLDRLAASGVALELLPTGLFSASGARPMDAGFAAHAWANDQRIERLSGQVFSQAYLDNVLNVRGTLLDSNAATLGVSAASVGDPRLRLAALKAIQRARYVDGRDIVTVDGVAEVLTDAGLADAAAAVMAPTDKVLAAHRELVGRGRALFQRLHAHGVPSLAVIRNDAPRLIGSNALFGSYDNLVAHIQAA
ncbi:DsbA family protein [Mesorhizobium sp. M2D.F.Ca.ET.185.01.1.1]|uniref:DsbA family protein n=1 Tax=unclassified Mesorhizobium TaxID=325217 RepID=UPI000FCB59E1|nr:MULTISPECIES: DsbA family protein [unclassified Mesorhizobium]TGP56645.1 DsbA family protein [bacterium M00.F.Ca.ET.230.01.1.1]TGP74996.1 DsbA family protein [bacterium M00.F.Ca.ET.227.01.1.1]TGP85323.1 DsbA family protein [bacterium M00.F.Ca.ET.221.01.1.1]TGP89749.1 DsbA family protein [bacterium M00.F.Ca.ET.222.01.1.1]TGT67749.1 DsbA family protein [bacterium M00.F.Ca.ET.159.01.1.1]TGT80189.1 DsbA family protein [bacterium M00.F.Ca.ET.157.01.1.1]TGU05753.1 DsbA family protein [bacterium